MFLRGILMLTVILGLLLAGCAPAYLPITEPETVPMVTAYQETEATVQVETVPSKGLLCAEAADGVEAGHIFVSDPETGQILYCSTDPGDKVYPASITKLFSAWVALRFLPGDAVVTVGWELGLLEPGSSSAFLALDSRLTVEDLIRGMLMPSGNDAALVLATAVGREILRNPTATAREAVAEFVAEMNRAAEVLNLQNTHFENPHGCHAEDHYSCPADLSVMAALAVDESLIRDTIDLREITVTARSGERYTWRNTNRLVHPEGNCPEAIGMKTGYTDAAGYCLLAAFGEERPLVVGVFGCSDSETRYNTAEELYRLCSAEEQIVQAAVLHQQIQGRAGEQQYDDFTQCDIECIHGEGTTDVQ